jgi:signal transduction histidine kinase
MVLSEVEIRETFYHSERESSGLIAVDIKGKLLFTNNMASSLLDEKSESLRGKDIKELIAENFDVNYFKQEENRHGIFNLIKKNSSKSLVFYRCDDFLNEHHEKIGLLFKVFKTGTKNLANELYERMDRLQTVSELSVGLAHELRNPLAGLSTLTQVLEELASKNTSLSKDEIIPLTKRMLREVKRSNRLLTEFFKFSHPSKPEPQKIEPEQLINGIRLLMMPILRKSKTKFEVKVDLKPNKLLCVDIVQMEQAIYRVLVNAIESMGKGGKICVNIHNSSRELKIAGSDKVQKDVVEIEISDSGKGIAKGNLEKIFYPFFTTKKNHPGLGLAIAGRLLKENNSWIEVNTDKNVGTKFTLLIPST